MDALFKKLGKVVGSRPLPPSLPAMQACKWHNGSVSFGQRWKKGDVVGCLLDVNEKSMCEWQLQLVSNAQCRVPMLKAIMGILVAYSQVAS